MMAQRLETRLQTAINDGVTNLNPNATHDPSIQLDTELDSISKRFPNLTQKERALLKDMRARAAAGMPSPAAAGPRPTAITWLPYEDGLTAAQRGGKRVLVDFMAEWCGWCKKMDKDVYSNPSVIALSVRYVFVKVDADQRSDLTQRYGVTGFPTTVVLDSAGREINRIVGYVDAQRFLAETQ